jgi:hypothetical protein
MADMNSPAGTGKSLKGSGPYPATKQTGYPVGKSKAPGKPHPKQTSYPTGAPSGGK